MTSGDFVILGDILRPDNNLQFGSDHNIKWLSNIICNNLSGNFIIFDSEYFQKNFPAYFREIFSGQYASYGDIAAEWARYYDADFLPQNTRDLLDRIIHLKILCFETPPSILQYIDEKGGKYIDIKVSPIRFGRDLMLSFFSNDVEIQRKLKLFELPNWLLFEEAAICGKKISQKFPKFKLPTDSVVFLAQSSFDSTLISDGKLLRLTDHRELIESLVAGRRCFLVPHPNEPNSIGAAQFLDIFASAEIIHENTYNLMYHAEDLHFLTISSGSGTEAEILCSNRNNIVSFVSKQNMSLNGDRYRKLAHVAAAFWSSSFWNTILLPSESILELPDFMVEPDRLRNHIGERWSKTF